MSKYRFKTEEEFKRDGLWNKNRPVEWVSVMNKYLGQDISDKYNQACDKQEKFRYDQWHIEPHDYVLKETAFVLPSKWCIKVTEENWSVLDNYFKRSYSFFKLINNYIYVDKNGFNYYNPNINSDYKEITFEQFKQHVLKESPVVETKKEMFHEGDYIVTLINDANCGKVNYCSKQDIDCRYLKPVIDTKGYPNNGNSKFLYTDTSNTKWRYATPEEAAEYERIGKPYDVTTLQKKEESIPEYVECIKSITNSFTVGKIYDWPYPINDQGDRRAIPIQGALFSFKPSTKEAYEAQFVSKELTKEDLVEGEIYFYNNQHTIVYPSGPAFYDGKYESNVDLMWFLPTTHATEEQKDLLRREIERNSKPEIMWPSDPIVEQRISTPSIKKETFIDNVQSVDVILRTKRKSFKF